LKAIANLTEAHTRLGIAPRPDATFFTEWKAPFPPLTDTEKARLDHLKQRYLYYADSGAITEGTVNLILLSPAFVCCDRLIKLLLGGRILVRRRQDRRFRGV
jgi:hypothetical protein